MEGGLMTQFETLRALAAEHGMVLIRVGGGSAQTYLMHGPLGKWQLFGLDAVASQLERFGA
jgi:hypothetical protein